jgi:hypothetical protein
MNTDRKTAIVVGVLYIIGTVSGVLSLVLTGSIFDAPDYLVQVAANANQVIIGALFVLLMGFALTMVPVVMFPILRKLNEVLALGYVVFRGALETFAYMATVICWLSLITLSHEFVTAGALEPSHFRTLGILIQGATDAIDPVTQIVFSLGALMFYYLLYRSKLIPRWLSGWGLVGAVLYLGGGLYNMFSSELVFLLLPLGLQEMVMAVWLIAKGFNMQSDQVWKT